MAVKLTSSQTSAGLYSAFWNRAPDSTGQNFWVGKLDSGAINTLQMATAFYNAPEGLAAYPNWIRSDNNALVTQVYNSVFNRAPDAAGKAFWVAQLNSGVSFPQVVINMMQSAVDSAAAGNTDGQQFLNEIQVGIYVSETLRTDNPAITSVAFDGVTYQASSVAIREAQLSQMAATTYTLTTSADNVSVQVNNANIVGTQATFQAFDTINGNGHTSVKLSLTDTGTAGWTVPAASVNGVQTVSLQNINGTVATPAVKQVSQLVFNDYTYAASAGNITVNNVATDPVILTLGASITGANQASAIATAINTAPGSKYIATVSGNTVTLTANTAGPVTAPTSTLTPGGAGSAGGATSAITVTAGAADAPSTSQLDTIDAAQFIGATTFISDRSTGAVTINNLANGQSATIIGNGVTTNGALTAAYATAATAATVDVSSGVTGAALTVTGTNVAATTINSIVANNNLGAVAAVGATLNIHAATALSTTGVSGVMTTINVDGAAANVSATKAAVVLGILDTDVRTVNASGLTAGGISATLSNAAQVITGGAGNDTITTGGVVLMTGSVDAGAGTADRLIVTAATDITATSGAKYTNFEILRNNDATANVVVSRVAGITSLEMNAANFGGFTGMTAAQALAVTNMQNNAGATLALTTATGTSDVLTVNLKNATATNSASLQGVTINGFETMNVVANTGGVDQVNALNFTSADKLTALNLSGAAPIAVTTTNITTTGGTAINASALTYAGTATTPTFTITGNLVKGSSVIGSDQIDNITTTAAAAGVATEFVTYNAGAGNDAISSTVAAINNNGGAFASVKIDGGAGTDSLTITDAATMVDANFQYLTNIEALTFTAASGLNLTAGTNFQANFATNGVTITDAGIAGDSVVNIANFTGNVKATLTQAATGADADDFTVTTGTGNDTVSLTTVKKLTGVNTVSTGSGNDTITVTSATLGVGSMTVNAGSGNDSITTAGTAAITVNGGTGADAYTLSSTGVNKVVQTMGDSVAASANTLATIIANGNTISFANGVDVINSFAQGTDKIDADVDGALASGLGLLSSTAQTTNYALIGNYANGVFTVSATGTDTLLSLGKTASTLDFTNTTDYVVVVGVTTLASTDII